MGNPNVDKIIETLNAEFGLIREEAWFTSLKKTALSKNITTADWNALLWQVVSTVSGTDAVKKALTDAIIAYDERTSNIESALTTNTATLDENTQSITLILNDLTLTEEVGTTANKLDLLNTSLRDTAANVTTNEQNITKHFKDVETEFEAQNKRFKEMVTSSKLIFDKTNLTMRIELYDANNNLVHKSTAVSLPKQSALADFYVKDGELMLETSDGSSVGIPISELLPTLTTSLDINDDTVALSAATGPLIVQAINDAVGTRATTVALDNAIKTLNDKLDDATNNIKGAPGDSAYTIAVNEGGFEGDVSEWLESLKGKDGSVGKVGPIGPQGPTGVGILDISKLTSTVENGVVTDTYNIVYDDSSKSPTTFKVTNGKDGVSITHKWVGTKLEVTSSTGTTTSPDLKGIGINNITYVGQTGLTRKYKIALTDSSEYFFTVNNGETGIGVVGIEEVDITEDTDGRYVRTYAMVLSDNTRLNFTVKDGRTGPRGAAFSVSETYSTYDDMVNDYSNEEVPMNAFVMVLEYAFDEDDIGGALFIKESDGFKFITRFQGLPGADGKDGADGTPGKDGKDGVSVSNATLDVDGNLNITLSNGTTINVGHVVGRDGTTPTISISEDGYWVINGVKSNTLAIGRDGADGTTPTIGISADGYWVINGVRQSVRAIGIDGTDGATPYIDSNNYWVIGDTVTGVIAKGKDGKDGKNGKDGVSVTHSWDDTSLVITSASGTSRKDLKGKSAYEIAQDNGFSGTETEWLESLKGNYLGSLDATDKYLQVFATNGTHGLLYHLYDYYAECAGMGASMGTNLDIGSLVKGLPVTSVTDKAFYSNQNITSVTIPPSVTTLGFMSFAGCYNLENIYYNAISVRDHLARSTFFSAGKNANLKLTIGSQVKRVPDGYLATDFLKAIIFEPDSVCETISANAFSGSYALKEAYLPKSIRSIGDRAFWGCANLKNVYYYGSEEEWNAIQIGIENTYLTNATIHYNYGGVE